MDEYLDQYFSSSSSSYLNAKERSSWFHSEPDQPNAWLPNSLGVHQDDKNNLTVGMSGSNRSMECLAAHGTPLGVEHGLLSREGMLNGTENLGFGNMGLRFSADVHSLTGLETLTPIPQLWHPQPYDSVLLSLPTLMGQTRTGSSCLQGENGHVDGGDDHDGNINRFVEIDHIFPPENLYASINAKSSSHATNNGCNGIGKPRVRARRGQATDPHSIAERLRREKISERMKNLQELVPNSNKTDKASMLNEIIEYVKFLQLQVKVLSMSRLGAAGAVVPLITDGQAEGSNGLTLTPLAGGGVIYPPSPEQVVFEQEVVKLMEANVTMAMQYLQSKGLCLMPIALAAAISNGKGSSSGPASGERKKFGFTNGAISNDDMVHNSSSSNDGVQNSNSSSSSGNLSGVGIHQLTSDGNFMIEKLNSCNDFH